MRIVEPSQTYTALCTRRIWAVLSSGAYIPALKVTGFYAPLDNDGAWVCAYQSRCANFSHALRHNKVAVFRYIFSKYIC
jgi:hypothetical protein